MAITKNGYDAYDESKNNIIQQAKWEWEQADARGDEAGKAAARKKAEDERNRMGYSTSGDGTGRVAYTGSTSSTPAKVSANTYVAPTKQVVDSIDESSNNIIQRGKELWAEGDRTGNQALKDQGRAMAEAERNRQGYSTDSSGLNRQLYSGTNYALGSTYYKDGSNNRGSIGTGTEAYSSPSNMYYNDSFVQDTKQLQLGSNGRPVDYSQQKADSKNAVAWIPGLGRVDVTVIDGKVQEAGLPQGTIITPVGSEKSYEIDGANTGGYTVKDYTGNLSLEKRTGNFTNKTNSNYNPNSLPAYRNTGGIIINGVSGTGGSTGGSGGGIIINGSGGGIGLPNYSGGVGNYTPDNFNAPQYVDNAGKIVIPEMQENPYAKELEALLGQLKDYTPEDYMTIEEAIARANARLGNQYDANIENIINQNNREAISRGMFGQIPTELVKQTALAENELQRQAGINNLADSIRNQNINIVDRKNANALAGLEQQYNMTNDLYNKEYINSRNAIEDAYRDKQWQYQVDNDTYNRQYQDYRNNISDDFRDKQWQYQQDVDAYNRNYTAYRDSVSDAFRNQQWNYQVEQDNYNKAMQKLDTLGYADESVAALLGVPVGTPSSDQRLQQAKQQYEYDMLAYQDSLGRDRALFDSQLSRDDYAYKSGIDYDEAARKAAMQYNYDVSLDNIRTGNDAYLKGLGGSSGGSSGSSSSSGSYDGSTNPGSGKPYSYYYNLASDLTKDALTANKNLEVDGYTFTTNDLMSQDGIEKLAQMLWERDYYGYSGNIVGIDPEDANDVSSLFPIGSMYPVPWLNPYENGAYDRVKNNGGSTGNQFSNYIK